MHVQILSLVAALAPFVFADVEVTKPPAGTSIPPGTIQIAWKDSGSAPALSDLTTYSINLCAGGNAPDTFSCTLAALKTGGTFAAGNVAAGDIPAAAGADATHG